jgi:hypothetical protein
MPSVSVNVLRTVGPVLIVLALFVLYHFGQVTWQQVLAAIGLVIVPSPLILKTGGSASTTPIPQPPDTLPDIHKDRP